MGSEWKSSTLGETCYITDGAHSKVDRQESGVPYLTSKNFSVGSLKLDKVDYITEGDFSRLFTDTKKSQRRLRDGDVLTGIIGTFGNAYRYTSNDHFGISSSVAILRPNPEILDADYLYYVITSHTFRATVEAFKGGSVQGYTNIATLKVLPIPLPKMSVQRMIVTQLKRLDQKIQLNRQTNQTLEHMAQALFKSWFVDFDPVIDNALAAGNDIPEALQPRAALRKKQLAKAEHKPLAKEILDLFPSEFEETGEMGWVPKGWNTETAEKIATVAIGKTPPRKQPEWFSKNIANNIVWISIRDMGVSGIHISNSSEYLTKEAVEKFNVKMVSKGSVLLSFKLTLGRVAITNCDLTTNEAIAHFSDFKNGLNKEYMYSYLNTFNYGSLGSTSSIATAVNSKIIKAMPILLPSTEVLNEFKCKCQSWFEKLSIIDSENVSLEKLRDTLLPKLISGELRIHESADMLDAISVGLKADLQGKGVEL